MGLFKKKPVDPEIKAAYDQAYKEERIKVVQERARARAHDKPFYQKLGGAVGTIGKGLVKAGGGVAPKGKPRGDPFEFFMGTPERQGRGGDVFGGFSLGTEKPARRVKHRKRRR